MKRASVVISRRVFLGGLGSAVVGCATAGTQRTLDAQRSAIDAIESRVGGRLGLFARASDSGRILCHRADELFPLCSTFKWVLAAAVLAGVDERRLALDQDIEFGVTDLVDSSPVVAEHVAQGKMSVEALARAAVVTSDNTAANLLLTCIGGPSSLTLFLRGHGDVVTRLDRNELALNSNLPGDPRDTTSPRAMVATLEALLTTDALSPANRERLLGWMNACETGKERLRAGLPSSWRVGDKTGTGERGAANDVAIAWPPGRGPIFVAAYLSDSTSPLSVLNAAHAEIGRLVAQVFGLGAMVATAP